MCCRRSSQKVVKPCLRRELAEWTQVAHQMSQRRVAGLIPVERGTLVISTIAIGRRRCGCDCVSWRAAVCATAIVGRAQRQQRLADGRWIRVLTVVDQFTRECLCLHADTVG